jgi:tetratricopeptide (TPR) repeat protein
MKAAIQAAHKALTNAGPLSLIEKARLTMHLGRLLKLDGQLDQSLHHLDEAARLADHLVDIHLERGEVFLARRQHKAALQAFEKAALVAPQDPKPHLQGALALKEAKDYAGAEKGLRRAAELSPKDRSIQRQLAAVIALNLVHHEHDIEAAS